MIRIESLDNIVAKDWPIDLTNLVVYSLYWINSNRKVRLQWSHSRLIFESIRKTITFFILLKSFKQVHLRQQLANIEVWRYFKKAPGKTNDQKCNLKQNVSRRINKFSRMKRSK